MEPSSRLGHQRASSGQGGPAAGSATPSALHTSRLQKGLASFSGSQFGTEAKRNYVYHAICGWKEGTQPPSTETCSTADGPGLSYQKLALLTGGIIDSVCKTNYSSVLDNVGKGIVDRLACELGYPTAEAAGPTKVQVRFTPPGGVGQKLVQVTDASECDANPDGWYFDDPSKPAKIILCKSICDAANSAPAATSSEQRAIADFLRAVSALDLHLPGDPRHRKLRFRAQVD
jgi:hypothetical protein